jgi:hypothetical protein
VARLEKTHEEFLASASLNNCNNTRQRSCKGRLGIYSTYPLGGMSRHVNLRQTTQTHSRSRAGNIRKANQTDTLELG